MVDFSSRLRDLRKKKGVTQKIVADFLVIHEQSYQKYELGIRKHNYETIIKLASYFNVSIDYLLGQTDNPERNL